ncbi:MAG: oligosaccharide flippase family protein [Desulfovibrio sp.]|jgi:PST family polysaccharide transporter|nr:oligosaccharide flippase family protein [Desulfovibrio sp.]
MSPSDIARGIRPYLATFVSFNAIQASQILSPLLALPLLARVLGPEAYGLVMYMTVISVTVGQIMDWGFVTGATREAAVCRERPDAQARLLESVLSAKFILAAFCVLLSIVSLPILPHAAEHPGAYTLSVLWGICRGLNPTWFFQGLGHGIRRIALWDVCSSGLVLLLTFIFVRETADWPRYPFFLVLCKGATYAHFTAGLVRQCHVVVEFRVGGEALLRNAILFAGTLSTFLYSHGAQLVLGFFLIPEQMGILVTADKIARGFVWLGNPVFQTLFPEVCAGRFSGRERAMRLVCSTLVGVTAAMLCVCAFVNFTAPWICSLFLGQAYEEAVSVLRVMICFIPIIACNMVLGTQALVAFGHEKTLVVVQTLVGIPSLPVAALLGYKWGLIGGSWFTLLAESAVLLGLIAGTLRLCPGIFFRKTSTEAQ